MVANRVVRDITSVVPGAVPDRLAENLSAILSDFMAVHDELYDAVHGGSGVPQVRVALTWVVALEATNGAFWAETKPPKLAPFGAGLLAQVSLQTVGLAPPRLHRGGRPTELELQRLSAVLMKKAQVEGRGSFYPLLLSWVLRAALDLAPRELGAARVQLGKAALKVGQALQDAQRHSSEDERLELISSRIALQTAATGCYEPGSQLWGMSHMVWGGELEERYKLSPQIADLREAKYHYEQANQALPPDSMEGMASKFMLARAAQRLREVLP